MNVRILALGLAPVICLAPSVAAAGGELSAEEMQYTKMSARTAETRQRIANLNAGLYQLESEAALAARTAMGAKAAQVVAVQPVQDKYGDPMYTWYGPLVPEKGTPMYDGPRYAASFDRGYLEPVPDGNYRGYARGRFQQAGFISHTDVVLGTAANNSYMQHGMQVAPGSMAASAARAMINNP